MDKNILEDKLRNLSEKEAFDVFIKENEQLHNSRILNSTIFPYTGQFTVKGHQLISLYGIEKSEIPKLEEQIDWYAEKLYQSKVNDLLSKLENINYLFED